MNFVSIIVHFTTIVGITAAMSSSSNSDGGSGRGMIRGAVINSKTTSNHNHDHRRRRNLVGDEPTQTPTSCNPYSQLVVNGDFEDGLSRWYANSNNMVLQMDVTDRGNSALNKERTATWQGVQQTLQASCMQKAIYVVSCYAKIHSSSVGATTDTNFKLSMKVTNSYGVSKWRTIKRTINSNDWTLVQGELNLGNIDGTITDVKFYAQGVATTTNYWVDDMSAILKQTDAPSLLPSKSPSVAPTTAKPTTAKPTTSSPTTLEPTVSPSKSPTDMPTPVPSKNPTSSPSDSPSFVPSKSPSRSPTLDPTARPTSSPTDAPTDAPTNAPSESPSHSPSLSPTLKPTAGPSLSPSKSPTEVPTDAPTNKPTHLPSNSPTATAPIDPYSDLVENGGFEDGLSPWYANSNSMVLQIDMTDRGNAALSKDRTATWQGVQQDLTPRLTAIQKATYVVSCYAKIHSSTVGDSSDNFKLTMKVTTAENGNKWKSLSSTTIYSNGWTFVQGHIDLSGIEGSITNVYFYAQGSAPTTNFWVDDMSAVLLQTDVPSASPSKSPTTVPSSSPSASPTTNEPSSSPSMSPTNAPQEFTYGNGPFVTLGTSSEIVTIPRPPEPSNLPWTFRTNCPHEEAGLLDWHDSNTWGGQVPTSGDITLPSNSKVVIRQSVIGQLGVVHVPATSELIFDENEVSPITLDIGGMDVQGAIRAGSKSCHYLTELTITLHGQRPDETEFDVYGKSSTTVPTYKGISVNGGILSIHGKRYHPTWTRLSQSVASGQTYLLVQEEVNWEVGQEIVVVTTAVHDSRYWHQNEKLMIASIETNPISGVGAAIHFTTPLEYDHIANNMYQAEVGLLTRNIKIQGSANASDPTDTDDCVATGNSNAGSNYAVCPNRYKTGFGGHIMIHSGAKGYMEGVELYRMGQTNVLGRYPFHWHVLGNDCEGCFFKANSIHQSYYRCISIHGTHNTTVSENVAYDVTGYCYYLEDAIEEDNTISYNLAAHINSPSNIIANPPGGQTIDVIVQSKDLILPADATASGYYLSNLHNDIVGNAASGGWAGFALPVFHSPVGPHKDVDLRPANRLTKTFDGNTAHSTGWWWTHAGAFYSGGSLYYNDADPTLLEYNAGRDQEKGNRNPCNVITSSSSGNCGAGDRSAYTLTNNKVFLTPSPGINSWSGQMNILKFEAHDVALGSESLSSQGFGIDQMLVNCRSGEEWVLPQDWPSNPDPSSVSADGFFWYDTGQEHIITNSIFRSCGYRSSEYTHDSSPERGCDSNSQNGCKSSSTVWGFLTHSDEHTPEIMQATKNITYIDCGRRFRLKDFKDNNNPSSVSGRAQNWMDEDGSASGLNERTIIGSGLTDSGHWWNVEDDVVMDPEGPLTFIKVNNGPERGLGHLRFRFDDSLHDSVGVSSCFNGPKGTAGNNTHSLCPSIGRIRHMGTRFDLNNDASGGLPITPNTEVAGPVGGFGWLMQLDSGSPKSLTIGQIEVDPSTPLVLALPYPAGTTFTVTANARSSCNPSSTLSCTEEFTAVDSLAKVRFSQGNVYFFDAATNLLHLRVIQGPDSYVGDTLYTSTPTWRLWTLDDPDARGGSHYALDRYTFNGVTLVDSSSNFNLKIDASCNEEDPSSLYCPMPQGYSVQSIELCPAGYEQTAYDKCCLSSDPTICYEFTQPPSMAPTLRPTLDPYSDLVVNGDFESGTLPWYGTGSATLQLDLTDRGYSALITDRSAKWNGVQQDLPVEAIRKGVYSVSCYAKIQGGATTDSIKLTMKVTTTNGDKTWKSLSSTSFNNNDWTFIQGDIDLTSIVGTIEQVNFYTNGPLDTTDYWVDDLTATLLP